MVQGQVFDRSQLRSPTSARAQELVSRLSGVTITGDTVTLGSGAYGEVNLMILQHNGEQTVILDFLCRSYSERLPGSGSEVP